MALRPVKDVLRLASKALDHGGQQTGIRTVEWRAAKRCESPVWVSMRGRDEWKGDRTQINPRAFTVNLWAECRRCASCLRQRAKRWRARSRWELAHANRTWMATFTLSPEAHYRLQVGCEQRLKRQGTLWRDLSPDERISELMRTRPSKWQGHWGGIGDEITKWLKTVRAAFPHTVLRYSLVVEKHKSGLPHLHALLHEHGHPISWRGLTYSDLAKLVPNKPRWGHGFTTFKLVESNDKAAWYVSKYIAKEALTRVRASSSYGSFDLAAYSGRGAERPVKTSRPKRNLVEGLPHEYTEKVIPKGIPHPEASGPKTLGGLEQAETARQGRRVAPAAKRSKARIA